MCDERVTRRVRGARRRVMGSLPVTERPAEAATEMPLTAGAFLRWVTSDESEKTRRELER
eukprot:1193975-Prorocentrum_minimum.AAC.4